jgi:hypothetical protein
VSPQSIHQTLDEIATELRVLGIDPDDPRALRQAAAVGLAHALLRNTAWEELHTGERGLSNGEMMRANSATVELIRSKLISPVDWRALAAAVTSPTRQLPDGRTFQQYAGSRLKKVRRKARSEVTRYELITAEFGEHTVLMSAAATTFMFGSGWHGMPEWPTRVAEFCRLVEHPADEHWREQPLAALGARPDDIADTGDLRRLLIEGPHHLSADAAAWCLRAGLGRVRV